MSQSTASAPARLIVTLTAEAGKGFATTGECIAAYYPEDSLSGYNSIVFLPKGPQPNSKVRVELLPIRDASGQEKKDKRDNVMYRSRPAPVEYVNRWQETASGLECRTVSINWLLAESDEGVVETRLPATREVPQATTTSYSLVWGNTLADSRVRQTVSLTISLQQETVVGHQLEWRQTGTRQEPAQTTDYPMMGVAPYQRIVLTDVQPANDWQIVLQCSYQVDERKTHNENCIWGQLPAWAQASLLAGWSQDYPVCQCVRQRVNPDLNRDGYTRCQLCRGEETCARCSQAKAIQIVSDGRYICQDCRPMDNLEALVHEHLPQARRLELDVAAEQLLASQYMEPETGIMVLEALLSHVPVTKRAELLQQWSGYPHYYFSPDSGVWGSKFGPEALQILSHFDQARGNGLVNLVAWLVGGHTSRECEGGYYWQTQVLHQAAQPSFSEYDLRDCKLAVLVRQSETARQAALAIYEPLVTRLGVDSTVLASLRKLMEDDQDYLAVPEAAKAVQTELARVDAGEILLNLEQTKQRDGTGVKVYDSQGGAIQPDWSTKRWDRVEPDQLAVRWDTTAGQFEVLKRPVGGVTTQQAEAVERLEAELGISRGAFGLNEVLKQQRAVRLKAIRMAAARFLGIVPEFTLEQVSNRGVAIWEEPDYSRLLEEASRIQPDRRIYIRWQNAPNSKGGMAGVVRRVLVAEGVLELLIYRRSGTENIELVWRQPNSWEWDEIRSQLGAQLNTDTTADRNQSEGFWLKSVRHYQCQHCGSETKLDQSAFNAVKNGLNVPLVCRGCGTAGVVSKATTLAAQPQQSPTKSATTGSKVALDFGALKGKGFKLGGA